VNIVVLVKQTPDTAELPNVSADAVRSGAVDATMVINPWDEFAVEEAIQLAERFDGEATALTLGPNEAMDALKHALAMGVDGATLIEADALTEIDDWNTAALLVAAIQQQGDVDLVLSGRQGVDGNSGSVFTGVACKLGWPLLVNVSKIIDIGDRIITVERQVEGGKERVTAPLPVVISVGKEINDPRYPSFMGIRKANRAEIPTTSAGELGVDTKTNLVNWINIRKPEARTTEVQIIEGETAQEKAAKLADALLAEKVI
jgi:electron transfer flavoprotein beta subunit